MLVEYYYDEDLDSKVPCCPRHPSTHSLSADPDGYYCYQCAEYYGEPVREELSK